MVKLETGKAKQIVITQTKSRRPECQVAVIQASVQLSDTGRRTRVALINRKVKIPFYCAESTIAHTIRLGAFKNIEQHASESTQRCARPLKLTRNVLDGAATAYTCLI